MQKNKHAFTLVELLVVVLIIGVLSAIAIPMYQGAVDKSHWSTMLPGAKAIKDAEEAVKMTNGAYTDEMANLDVTMNNSDLTFDLVTPNNTADPNVIRVTNSKLDNVRLASYLNDSPMFAGQLHCEAKTGDERAERLCGKLLMGQDLTSADGYTAYLLDQEIDKVTCDHISRTWSKKQTHCYKTEEDRCKANGMPYKDGVCGYTNVQNATVEEGGVCKGTSVHGCNNAKVYAGASCIGDVVDGCWRAQIYASGSCIANSFDGCWGATIHDGGKAICNAGGGCQQVVYEGTGCCEGVGCPTAHKCQN